MEVLHLTPQRETTNYPLVSIHTAPPVAPPQHYLSPASPSSKAVDLSHPTSDPPSAPHIEISRASISSSDTLSTTMSRAPEPVRRQRTAQSQPRRIPPITDRIQGPANLRGRSPQQASWPATPTCSATAQPIRPTPITLPLNHLTQPVHLDAPHRAPHYVAAFHQFYDQPKTLHVEVTSLHHPPAQHQAPMNLPAHHVQTQARHGVTGVTRKNTHQDRTPSHPRTTSRGRRQPSHNPQLRVPPPQRATTPDRRICPLILPTINPAHHPTPTPPIHSNHRPSPIRRNLWTGPPSMQES